MRILKKLLTFSLFICIIMSFALFGALADSFDSIDVLNSVNIADETAAVVPVSCALDVIASQNEMAIAGIRGQALFFSEERFACAMNLSDINNIVITRLPDTTCGSLYIGSDGVRVGQRITSEELYLMTYEEAVPGEGGNTDFEFRVNGSAYAITCNVYMLKEINYSPTVSLASYASLNNETYRNMCVSGVLSGYDPEGDQLKYEIVDYPTNGTIVLENENLGKYTYFPNDSFTGGDSFKYVVSDKYGNYSASAEVKISVSSPGTSAVYSDLIDDALHCHAIAVTECGLMNGVQIGSHYYFEADREVTRAEFLVTAMNAVGIKNLPEVAETGFFDNDDINPEMKGHVALAYSKGYISGTVRDGEVYFFPDETIKLSEAAVILSNMIGYASPKVTPVFADNVPAWSDKAIMSIYTLGILESPDMVSGAGEAVTRGDMAKLLNKTMFVLGK